MKIAFIVLALAFSMGVQAGEIPQTDGVTESATDAQARDERLRIAREEKNKDREATKREENRIREQERQATKPECANIRFTGVATSPFYRSAIAQVLASRDIEDTLARNPIRCDGEYNIFGKHNCTGVAFFKNHKGRIINWDKSFYIVNTPLDFNIGRRNVELAIRRQDAVCAN